MVAVKVVFRFLRIVFGIKGVYDYNFNLHLFGNNAFYVNACLLSNLYAVFALCKPCKVRGKLYKSTVIFHTANYTGNCFASAKAV